jgi:hypothetical protein
MVVLPKLIGRVAIRFDVGKCSLKQDHSGS